MARNSFTEERNNTQNENWTTCHQCGAKLFVDPDTGEPEHCATCESHSKKSPLVGGIAFMALVALVVIAILSAAIYMLVQ